MAARNKVTSIKFKNRARLIYDNDRIVGVGYENENKNYSEEYQEDEDNTENENDKNEDQDEYIEAEEQINECEPAYLQEDIISDDYNPVNKEQDDPIKKDQEDIEITGVNEISDTESTSSNVRRSGREGDQVERLEPTMKGKLYMQYFKAKNIDKHTKRNKQSYFGIKQRKKYTKRIHPQHGLTDS